MHILYVTQHFPPEGGAAAERALNLARAWGQAGHHITIITSQPEYFYSEQQQTEIQLDNVTIKRIASPKTDHHSGFVAKLYKQLVFSLKVARHVLFSRCDVALLTSPPFFLGINGLFADFFAGRPYIFEVRDLYPETAIAYGKLKNPLLIWIFRALEKQLYKNAELVVGVTEGIVDYIKKTGVPPERIVLSTNGVDTEFFDRVAQPDLPTELQHKDKFVVLYLGLMGLAQGLEYLIEAAERLKNEEKIVFLLVGDGPQKSALQALAVSKNLSNVVFHDSVPRDLTTHLLSAADLGVSTRRSGKINEGALPIKVFEYMACGLPVVVSPLGECSKMVDAAQGGIGVPAEDGEKLAQAIRQIWQLTQNERQAMGERARDHVRQNFSRKKLAADYLDTLNKHFSSKF